MKKLLLDNLVEISENGIQVKPSNNGALCFLLISMQKSKDTFDANMAYGQQHFLV